MGRARGSVGLVVVHYVCKPNNLVSIFEGGRHVRAGFTRTRTRIPLDRGHVSCAAYALSVDLRLTTASAFNYSQACLSTLSATHTNLNNNSQQSV